jgi:hypothetical protein
MAVGDPGADKSVIRRMAANSGPITLVASHRSHAARAADGPDDLIAGEGPMPTESWMQYHSERLREQWSADAEHERLVRLLARPRRRGVRAVLAAGLRTLAARLDSASRVETESRAERAR